MVRPYVFRRVKLLSTGEAISVKSESQFAGAVRNVIWEDIEVSATHAGELMDAVKEIHTIFWATKGRDIAWYTAS